MWQPKIFKGVCVNGCLEKTEKSQKVQDRMLKDAVGIGYDWQKKGEMPVWKWDDKFEAFLKERIELCDSLNANGVCLWPWRILEALPDDLKKSNRLFFSQGGIGSCMSHANSFAFHCATLIEIALGAPLVYHSINPIVSFYLSKGGSLRGGQTPSEMSEYTNKNGQWLEEWVGEDNQSAPKGYDKYSSDAKNYQTGICMVEADDAETLVEKIFDGCHAGLAFAYGQSKAVRGADTNSDGVKVATLGGSWAHATSVSSYWKYKGTEYIFWQNSHGAIYGQSDFGDPADGAWMDKKTFQSFIASALNYGYPYCVFPEGEISGKRTLNRLVNPTFPKGI